MSLTSLEGGKSPTPSETVPNPPVSTVVTDHPTQTPTPSSDAAEKKPTPPSTDDSESPRNKNVLQAVTAFLLVFVVFHVGIVCLMVAPTNYLQVRFANLIHGYGDPIFTQDWKLFAPTPVSSDTYISVKARNNAGDETDFINLTQHFLDEHKHNLLPTRTSWNLAQTALKFFDAREGLVRSIPSDSLPAKPRLFLDDAVVNKGHGEAIKNYRGSLEDMRRSVAAHILLDYPDATSMQIKLENVTFPSFQERNKPEKGGSEQDTTGWLSTQVDTTKDGRK